MEYRRRYFRRFGNHNQEEKSKPNISQNQKEEILEPPKNDKKINTQNVYLQKLLQKNNVQNSSNIAITSVNDNLPSFKNNIHDILSTDENKQRAIKYVIQKRNEGKKPKLQINTDNDQEESNPVLANRYTHYQNRNNLNKNNSNVGEMYNKYTNVNTNHNLKKEEMQQEIKPGFSHYYARRTKQPTNINKEKEIQNNKNIEENNEDINNKYRGRKIQISVSSNNMLPSPKSRQPFEKDEKVVVKKERYYNINSYRNNNSNIIKETEEPKPKYKYLRGYVKRFEEEHNEKENIKEKEKENEININKNNNQPKEVSINLNIGKNFSFGLKDMYNSSKSFGNQNSFDNIVKEESNKFRGYKNFKIVKNNFELGQKNKKDIYTKKFAFTRQKEKQGDNKKDIVKDKVIDFKLLGKPNNNENNATNTEAPVSRFRRKYGRYTSNLDNNTNTAQNLSFKDENEIISFLNKKYDQEKIIELFKIKNPEDQKNKKEQNIPLNNNITPDAKTLLEQLNEEKRKNEENTKKLKQLESNIEEQTNEIRDKNIGIGKKIQEIDKLKNDITAFKKDLQSKEKENTKLKNELEQTLKTESNKQNKLKDELDKIKKNYDSLIIENEKNVKDYNELLNENEQNKNDYNELLKDFETLQNKNTELIEIKNSKEELDKNYIKTKEENSKLKSELDLLKKNYDVNKESLEKYKNENEKIKGEMNIVTNLNDKLMEDNGKIKEEIKNTNSDLEKNKQQNLELNKTKDKYYKLLDDYKQLTRDCNILRDEKTSIQIEQKQMMHEYKISQDENNKLKNDYNQLKELYDKLVSEMNINNKSKVQIPKSILKKSDNKTIEIEKDISTSNNLEQENPTYKTIIIENTKPNEINLISKENEKIEDKNDNNNDKIQQIQINNNESLSEQNESLNVKFNIDEKQEDNNNNNSINDQEKNKLDEERKNTRLSKAMLRIKKKQESLENNSQIKLNKSLKVQDLVKELENNMQKRDITCEKEELNGGNEIQIENGANVVNVLDNQQLTKSMKKKKKAKQFDDGEN